MKILIIFFQKYGVYFLFIFLEITALLLVVNHNRFQRSVFFSSLGEFSGFMYEKEKSITEYFTLRGTNEELAAENTRLKNELMLTQNELHSIKTDSLRKASFKLSPEKEYTCYSAKVINNSTNKAQNYITLNRGWSDGITEEMTVVNAQGVVGIVTAVSRHFSIVMPILNPHTHISCKIRGKNKSMADSIGSVKDIGTMQWDNIDYRFGTMTISRHIPVQKGDSVITSGYSDFFPEGILVGKIDEITKGDDDNNYDVKVRLAVNFKTLSYVNVFDYKHKREQERLEQKAAEAQTQATK